MAIGVQAYVLVANFKANIVSLIHIRLYSQKLAVEGRGSNDVFYGINNCFDTLIHDYLFENKFVVGDLVPSEAINRLLQTF
jgi:hypothetical protein